MTFMAKPPQPCRRLFGSSGRLRVGKIPDLDPRRRQAREKVRCARVREVGPASAVVTAFLWCGAIMMTHRCRKAEAWRVAATSPGFPGRRSLALAYAKLRPTIGGS